MPDSAPPPPPPGLFRRILELMLLLVTTLAAFFFYKSAEDATEQKIRLEEELRRVQSAGPGKSQECIVCTTKPLEVCLEPCGHVCCCRDCAQRLQDKCPICRAAVVKKRNIFIAAST